MGEPNSKPSSSDLHNLLPVPSKLIKIYRESQPTKLQLGGGNGSSFWKSNYVKDICLFFALKIEVNDLVKL